MDFELHEVGIPHQCPECRGTGRRPYANCAKCQGTGYLIRAMLTYGEDFNTAGIPARQMFAGYIEIPTTKPLDC
jgi:uncharacterized phage protein